MVPCRVAVGTESTLPGRPVGASSPFRGGSGGQCHLPPGEGHHGQEPQAGAGQSDHHQSDEWALPGLMGQMVRKALDDALPALKHESERRTRS